MDKWHMYWFNWSSELRTYSVKQSLNDICYSNILLSVDSAKNQIKQKHIKHSYRKNIRITFGNAVENSSLIGCFFLSSKWIIQTISLSSTKKSPTRSNVWFIVISSWNKIIQQFKNPCEILCSFWGRSIWDRVIFFHSIFEQ